ncbi:cell wall-binding repeat-containing protein [Sulfobacillus harzensis]|uniref:Cell wall-binding repeat-containing protein n=1 Tax=Sulfobacillus harzensis TaxID=2729629 RepID=A0A7Y0L724_9FIRM|nr:cell wall-binding repeat-containing protein [Sulfobacillus harzensis]NMP24492.1 hypothetical protein [Sulfobacillus harzensis]
MTKFLRRAVWSGAGAVLLLSAAACGPTIHAAAQVRFRSVIRRVMVRAVGQTVQARAITARRVLVRYQFQAEGAHHRWRIVRPYRPSATYTAQAGETVRVAVLTAYQVAHHQWREAVTSGAITVPHASAPPTAAGSPVTTAAANLALPVSKADAFLYGPPSTTVVIAPSGTSWADEYAVLAANPLAYADHAPILLSASPTVLGQPVLSAMARLHATTAVLVGPANTPALRKALLARHLHVQGIGNGNPVQTGAAIARALQNASGQWHFSTVFVVTPNSAAADVTATSPADIDESPILVSTAPNRQGQISLPTPEAALAAQATTLYAIGAAGSTTVTGLPTNTQVVALGNSDPLNTAYQVDFHWFFGPWDTYGID